MWLAYALVSWPAGTFLAASDRCRPRIIKIVSGSTRRRVPPGACLNILLCPDHVLIINVYGAPDVTGEYRVSPPAKLQLPLLPAPIVAFRTDTCQLAQLYQRKYRKSEIYHPSTCDRGHQGISRPCHRHSRCSEETPNLSRIWKDHVIGSLVAGRRPRGDAGSFAIVTRGEIASRSSSHPKPVRPQANTASCDRTFSVDLSRLTQTGDPLLNVDLYPGDRVTVQRAGIVYVVGAVNRPGGFPLKTGQEKMTVIQALALAEDLKPTAAQKRAMIIRKNPAATDGREEIAVNLTKVLAGHEHDTQLQANDILFVPDSAGKRALPGAPRPPSPLPPGELSIIIENA